MTHIESTTQHGKMNTHAVADPGGGGRGPPPSEVFVGFFCLSVYETSRGPGPYPPPLEEFLDPPLIWISEF